MVALPNRHVNEIVIPDLIDALDQEGEHEKATTLRTEWEKKVKSFINDHPYLYGSEYPYDTTGFESTAALAKYAMARVPGARRSAEIANATRAGRLRKPGDVCRREDCSSTASSH